MGNWAETFCSLAQEHCPTPLNFSASKFSHLPTFLAPSPGAQTPQAHLDLTTSAPRLVLGWGRAKWLCVFTA
jgi:hypothetical protein